MKEYEFKLIKWLDSYKKTCKYNLSNSGMPEPDLKEYGIDTSYDHFLSGGNEIDYKLRQTIGDLYGYGSENVLLTIGGSEAIFIVSSFLSMKAGKMIIPLPEYEPMFLAPQSLGMKTYMGETDLIRDKIDSDSALSFTNPNNPSGNMRGRNEIISSSGNAKYIYVDETFRNFSFPAGLKTEFDGTDRLI
ncbi:MAG: hypothetical protein ACP5UV_07515, partial [Thermoplasmata archaeon]